MTKQEAIEYLEQVLDHWTSWHDHHLKLVRALEVLLEETKDDKVHISHCSDCD